MDDLIEALQIMRRHSANNRNPTHCEHDELYVYVDDVRKFSQEEKKRLDELGFIGDFSFDDDECEGNWYDWDLSGLEHDELGEHRFLSYRFGSR